MADDEVVPVPESATARPRRRVLALWAVLAVLGLGVGLLAVRSGDDDPPKLPVALGAAGDDRSEALTSPAAADMAMFAYVHYVAGDDLPVLGDDGPAYELGGDVSEGRVRQLADALGLDADPTRGESGWVVDDGDGGHLEVFAGAGGSWWYTPDFVGGAGSTGSAGSAGSAASAGATEEDLKARESAAVAAEEPTTTLALPPECTPDVDCPTVITDYGIVPPADLPSRDEARALALDLFRDAGIDVEDAKVTVEGPYEAWFVNVEPRVDGRTVSGYGWTASVGSKGKITSAGGTLNAPERLGDYPVLDTRKAIDRLNEVEGGYGVGGREVLAADLPCVTSTTAVGPADLDMPPTTAVDDPDASVSSDDVTIEPVPAPCAPAEPPEPVEVVLHDAEEILVLVSAFDGSGDAYLVPGYRFTGDGGAVAEVAAVDDDSLLPPPEQPVEDPGPVTTMPTDGPCFPDPDLPAADICRARGEVPPAEPTEAP